MFIFSIKMFNLRITRWSQTDHSKMRESEKQEYISQKIKVKDNREKK